MRKHHQPNEITNETMNKGQQMKELIGKLMCYFGYHVWAASLEDYVEEFGCVPLDYAVASTSVCERCGKEYKDYE